MSKKIIFGLILIIIGAILLLVAGLTVLLVQLPNYQMQVQGIINIYRPYYPTINVTANFTMLYVKSIFIIMVSLISLICGILMFKKNSKAAIICAIIGIICFVFSFIPVGYITLTITVQLVDDQGVVISGNVGMIDREIEGGFVAAGDIKDGMTIEIVPTEMVKAVVITDFRYE